MAELHGERLVKEFPGGVRALDGVSFTARSRRVLTLLGPSGCGKSTLLRIIAGLERAESGTLHLDGQPLDPLPPGQRDVGFVFQNYALYPHLTVADNLSLALRVRRLPKIEIAARIHEAADLLGIGDLLGRRPRQLSGGQQQRVAIGRALVRRPRLYLMDEPLSNLDALLRESTRTELKALFRRLEATVLYVTHDQAEAMSLSDEVLVMRAGRVLQCAPPLDLYARPADLFTATFVGSPRMNLWRGSCQYGHFRTPGLAVPVPEGIRTHSDVWLGVRPEDLQVSSDFTGEGWEARLQQAEPLGDRLLLTLGVGEALVRALVPQGDYTTRVRAFVPPARMHWFDATTDQRLNP
ncbi:MAG: ABC transporter ATP-binding protein [Vicinamibacterales bacterium]